MTDYLNDDENVKMMRDTAQRVGLTDLLRDMRRELVQAAAALRAQVTRALALLGVADDDDDGRAR